MLRAAGKTTEAYFHAGQSIEFLLKALYLKRSGFSRWPDDHRGARWHDLKVCAAAARLEVDLNRPETSKSLKANWLTVRDWKSHARFPDMKVPKPELNDLFIAVCDDADGVWIWLDAICRRA